MWKTERCVKFPMFKDKDGALKELTWKQIEPRTCLRPVCERGPVPPVLSQIISPEVRQLSACDTARATNCDKTDTDQDRKASAHLKCAHLKCASAHLKSAVLDYIQDCIIGQKKVVLLTSLRLLYIQELEKNGFANPEYRSEKLKARLENHDIHKLIAFAKVNPGDKGCITYNLVYSTSSLRI